MKDPVLVPRKSPQAMRLAEAPAPPAGAYTALACTLCQAVYLDYPDGRIAHEVVFGHTPNLELFAITDQENS